MKRLPRVKLGHRAGRGSVMLITGLLVSSAALRIASGMAFAEDSEHSAPAGEALEEPMQVSAEAPHSLAEAQPMSAPMGRDEMGQLLKAIQAREARIAQQEHQMALRAKALAVADAEITKRMDSLKATEEELRQTLALANGAAEDDLTRLTAVYESMKPKDSAALFEAMEPDFAAGFLGRMRPDIAASVMAGLNPETAYTISVILAGRNANVPKT